MNGTTYNVNLKAINQNGIGSPAAATSSVTPYGPPLAISGGLTVTSVVGDGGGRTLRVNFTPPDNNGSAITNYAYSTDNGATYTTRTPASTTLPIDITGLTNGVAYLVNVKAINIAGAGAAAAQSVAGTPARTPDAPTLLSVTPGDQRIICSFSPPANNGGSAITGYIVHCVKYLGTPSILPTVAGDLATNSATITGLINGETYGVWVVAANRMGNAQSNQLFTSPLKTPQNIPQITGIVAGNAQLQVSFTIPAGDTISNFEYSTNGGVTFKPFKPIQTTSGSYTITTTSAGAASLVNGTTYDVRLRATNAAGPGPSSTGITAIPYTVPGKPLNMQKVRLPAPNRDKAALSFTPPSSNGRPITNYEYSVNGGTTFTALNPSSTDTNPLVIPGLSMYTNYTVYVRAVNAAGAGEAGSTADVTITTSPRAPVVLSARLDYASSVIVEFIGFTTEVAGDLRPPGGETLTYEYSLSTSGSPGVYKNLTDLQSNAVSSKLRPVDPALPLGLQEWYSKFTVTSSGFNPLDNLSVYIRSRSVNLVSPVATYVVDTKSNPEAISNFSLVSSFNTGSSWATTPDPLATLTVSFPASQDNGAAIDHYQLLLYSTTPINSSWIFADNTQLYHLDITIPAASPLSATVTDLPVGSIINGSAFAYNSYGRGRDGPSFEIKIAVPTPAPVITGVINSQDKLEVHTRIRNFYEEYIINDSVIPRYAGTPVVTGWEYTLNDGGSWTTLDSKYIEKLPSSIYIDSNFDEQGTWLDIQHVQPSSTVSQYILTVPAARNTSYLLAVRAVAVASVSSNSNGALVSLPSRSHNVRTLSDIGAAPVVTSYTSHCVKPETGDPYLRGKLTFTVPNSYADDDTVCYGLVGDNETVFFPTINDKLANYTTTRINNTTSQITHWLAVYKAIAVQMYIGKFFKASNLMRMRLGVPGTPAILRVEDSNYVKDARGQSFGFSISHIWPEDSGGMVLTSIDYTLDATAANPVWVSIPIKDIISPHSAKSDFVPDPSIERDSYVPPPALLTTNSSDVYRINIEVAPGGQNPTHHIAIRAANKLGVGPVSSAVTFTTAGLPTTPKIISVVPENGKVHLLVEWIDSYLYDYGGYFVVYVNGVSHGYTMAPCFVASEDVLTTDIYSRKEYLYPYKNRKHIIIENQPATVKNPYIAGDVNTALLNGTSYEIYVVAATLGETYLNIPDLYSKNSNKVYATPAAPAGDYANTNSYGMYFNLWAKPPKIISTTADRDTGIVTVTYAPNLPPTTPPAISSYGKEILAVTYQFVLRYSAVNSAPGILYADVPQGSMTLDYLASLPADTTFTFQLANLTIGSGYEYRIGMRAYNGYTAPTNENGGVNYEDVLGKGHVKVLVRPQPSAYGTFANFNNLLGSEALNVGGLMYEKWRYLEFPDPRYNRYDFQSILSSLYLSGGYPWSYTTWGAAFHDRIGEFSYALYQYLRTVRDFSGGDQETWYEITLDGGVNYINTEYDEPALIGTADDDTVLLRGGQVSGLAAGVPYDFGVRMNSAVAGPSKQRALSTSIVYATKGSTPSEYKPELRMRATAIARDLDTQGNLVLKLFVTGGGFSNGSVIYTCDYVILNSRTKLRTEGTAVMLSDTTLTEDVSNSFMATAPIGNATDTFTVALYSRNSSGVPFNGNSYGGIKKPISRTLSAPVVESTDLLPILFDAKGFRLILDNAIGVNINYNDYRSVSGLYIYPSQGETDQTEPNIVSYKYNINGGINAPNDGQFKELKLNYSTPTARKVVLLGLPYTGTNTVSVQGMSLTGNLTPVVTTTLTTASQYLLAITGVAVNSETKSWLLQATYRSSTGLPIPFSKLYYIITAYSPQSDISGGGYSWVVKDINGVLLTKLNQSLQNEYLKVNPQTRTQLNSNLTIPQPPVFDGANDIICTVQLYDSAAGMYSNTYSFTINNTRGTPTITSYGTDEDNNLIVFIQDPPNPLPATAQYPGAWRDIVYGLGNISKHTKVVTLTPTTIPGKYTTPHYDTYLDCLIGVVPVITRISDYTQHTLFASPTVKVAQAVCTGLNMSPLITSIRRYMRLVPAAPDGIEYGVDVNIAGASFKHGELVTNYSYNLGLPGDATYTLLSPPQTTSPLTIRYNRLTSNKDFNLTIKAHTAQTESGISNVYVSPKPTLINWRYPGQQSAIFSNILAAYSSDGQSVVVTFAIDANAVDILNSSSKPEGYAYMLGKKPGAYITDHKIDLNTCYGGGGTYDLQEQLTPGWVTIPENSITRTENSFGGSFTLDRATYAEALNAGGIYGALTVWNVLTSAGTDYKMFYIPIPTIDDIPFISNLIVTSPSEAYYPSNSVKLQVKYNDGATRLIPGLTIKQFNCSINGADPITFTPQQPSAKNFISSDWLPGIIPGIDNHIYLSYTDTCGRTTQPSAFFIPTLSPSAFITAYHCNFGCVYPTITRASYTSPTIIHPTTPPPEGHVQVSLNNMVILPVWQHKDVTVFNDAHNSSPTPTRVISASLKPMPDGSRGVEIVFAPSTHADDVYYCFRYAEQSLAEVTCVTRTYPVNLTIHGTVACYYALPIRYRTVKSNLNPEYFDFSNHLAYKCHCPIPNNYLSLPKPYNAPNTVTIYSSDWIDSANYPGVRPYFDPGAPITPDTWLLGNFLGGINAFTQKSEGSISDSENNTSLISINYTSGRVNMHDNVNPKRLGLFWHDSAADPAYLNTSQYVNHRYLFSPGVWPSCVWNAFP